MKLPKFTVQDQDEPSELDESIKKLLVAIVHRAILDTFVGKGNPFIKRDAQAWLLNTTDSDMFSFIWICDLLNVDRDKLLRRLSEMQFTNGETGIDDVVVKNSLLHLCRTEGYDTRPLAPVVYKKRLGSYKQRGARKHEYESRMAKFRQLKT